MKSYDEMAKSVLERREQYRDRNRRISRSLSVSGMCICLLAVICVGGWRIAVQNQVPQPPIETDAVDTQAPIVVTAPPKADTVLDTTPGHDVTDIPTEIPGDVTVNNIPDYEILVKADYNIPITATSLFENADLVVIGVYEGTNSVSANEYMQIITRGTVRAIDVRKGDVKEDETIQIDYSGGVMTVSQIISSVPNLSNERLEKYGWLDMTKDEQEKFTVGYMVSGGTLGADLTVGEKYLFFLSRSEDGYFVMCDAYGARKINDEGKVYNPDTRLYEEIPMLEQYASLEEAKADEEFGKFMPDFIPDGFWAESIKHYKDETYNYLSGLWSFRYDDIRWKISYADEYAESRRTSADDIVNYDLSLYPIPRADSVPEELREIVDNPVFLAEEVDIDVIYRRTTYMIDAGEGEGYRINFSIKVGALVIEIRTDGITPETLYDMIKNIIG